MRDTVDFTSDEINHALVNPIVQEWQKAKDELDAANKYGDLTARAGVAIRFRVIDDVLKKIMVEQERRLKIIVERNKQWESDEDA